MSNAEPRVVGREYSQKYQAKRRRHYRDRDRAAVLFSTPSAPVEQDKTPTVQRLSTALHNRGRHPATVEHLTKAAADEGQAIADRLLAACDAYFVRVNAKERAAFDANHESLHEGITRLLERVEALELVDAVEDEPSPGGLWDDDPLDDVELATESERSESVAHPHVNSAGSSTEATTTATPTPSPLDELSALKQSVANSLLVASGTMAETRRYRIRL